MNPPAMLPMIVATGGVVYGEAIDVGREDDSVASSLVGVAGCECAQVMDTGGLDIDSGVGAPTTR